MLKFLLTALMEEKASDSQRIVTRNELWFFLDYPCDSIWAASRDEPPQRIKQKIDRGKCLVSVLWLVNGIRNLLDAPKGTHTTWNSSLMLLCPV
jgi:hypothetical protein